MLGPAPVGLNIVGHYRLTGKVGEGGMGVVYRARDEQLQRDVALKVLPASSFANPAARALLLREARAAAALNHPHVCTVHEVGEASGQAYIAMELVEGEPLSARLEAGALPSTDTIRYGVQLADALAHAHERGVIHRDFKSANVVVTHEGRAKVLDFGLAKQLRSNELDEATRSQAPLTAPGTVVGTLAYMAPEQLRGQPCNARSDIWSLGVVLYEMSTGRRPFEGRTGFGLSSAIMNEPPAPLPGKVPVELRAIVERCLEKDPRRRYQTAGEVRAALEAVQTGAVSRWVGWRYTMARRRWLVLSLAVVLAVAIATALNWNWVRERLFGSVPRIESIAVLPLRNLSGDPNQAYLSDGIQEALITKLQGLSGFRKVTAQASTERYEGSKQSPTEIAHSLGVDAVITGSVLRSGNRIQVTVQLIRAIGEQMLWAHQYDSELSDVLSVESDIVSAIIGGIRLQLNADEKMQLAQRRAINPEVYDLCLRARAQISKSSNADDFKKGMALLDQAVEKDTNESLVWSSMAMGYVLAEHQGWTTGALQKAVRAANKAIELDSSLAEAHLALAMIKGYDEWDYDAADQEYKLTLRLNPNLAEAHGHYSWLLLQSGRDPQQQEYEIRRAQELDPENPMYYWWMAQQFQGWGNSHSVDEAITQCEKALQLDPNFAPALSTEGELYADKGMFKEAIARQEQCTKLDPTCSADLARTYARAGRRSDALKITATLRQHPGPWQNYLIARIYAGLGDKDETLHWLEATYASRHIFTPWIGEDRAYEFLQDDPRFQNLLRRIGTPQAALKAK